MCLLGHGMKIGAIENLLDQCLLTDQEMALGPDQWKETMEHLDRINLVLEDVEEDEDEQEEEEEDDCKDKDCMDIKCTEK